MKFFTRKQQAQPVEQETVQTETETIESLVAQLTELIVGKTITFKYRNMLNQIELKVGGIHKSAKGNILVTGYTTDGKRSFNVQYWTNLVVL